MIGGFACTPDCGEVSAMLLDKKGMRGFGTLGGFAASVYSVSDSGIAVGQADTANTDPFGNGIAESVAFRIGKDDVLRRLGDLPGYQNSQAFDVNNTGEVVGWAYNFAPNAPQAPGFHGFLVDKKGAMRDLGTLPGGSESIARAISNNGVVVGGSSVGGGIRRAFVWEKGTMRELPSLGGVFAEATDVNERGDVVGSASLPGQPNAIRRAVLWPKKGGIVDLGTLGGDRSRAWGINASGVIVGESRLPNGQFRGFVYRDGAMQQLGTLGGTLSIALDVNDAGEIVGTSRNGTFGPFGPVEHGFVVGKDGVMRDIGTLP